MALVDADYKFLWTDVGSDGSSNDASIYNASELKEGMESVNHMFHLPEERLLPGDDVPIPYFIVGDNAFGINRSLMNPFSVRNIDYQISEYLTIDYQGSCVWLRMCLVFLRINFKFCLEP